VGMTLRQPGKPAIHVLASHASQGSYSSVFAGE
jgi:hypothetical protein